jgi:hypothetical protein
MTKIDCRRFVTALGAAIALPTTAYAAAASQQVSARVPFQHERQTSDLVFPGASCSPEMAKHEWTGPNQTILISLRSYEAKHIPTRVKTH